jgi:hypothetical protein
MGDTQTAERTALATAMMQQSFLLVLSTWTIERLANLLRSAGRAPFTHVIVERPEHDRVYHYLYSKKEVLDFIQRNPPEYILHQAFDLHEHTSVPEVQGEADVSEVPAGRAVVMSDEHAVGFFDDTTQPPLKMVSERALSQSSPAPAAAAAAGTGTGAVARPFSAFPALKAPDEAAPKDSIDVLVGFSSKPDAKVQGGGAINIPDADRGRDCLILLTGDGITLDPPQVYVPLRENALTSVSGIIDAHATSVIIRALYVYRDQVIGSVRRDVAVTGAVIDVTAEEAVAQAEATSARADPCRIQLPDAEKAVDITVSITSKQDGSLEWKLLAPAYPYPLGAIPAKPAPPNTQEFAADIMRDLKTQAFGGPLARSILESKGLDITAYIPDQFFEVLEAVHAAIKRPPTLLLLTNETYVPWELAYLHTPLDRAAPPFLAAQTVMGRWVEEPHVMLPPTVGLNITRFTAVASEYGRESGSGQRKLVMALAEQKALEAKWQTVNLEAKVDEIRTLVSGTAIPGHLVHFAIHGYSDPAANNQTLILADGSQIPASAMTGAYRCGGTPRFSFVFLNACQVGAPGRSLGHAGGFPGELVRRGTMGFIAPLWDVHDQDAHDAALAFYDDVFTHGRKVGEALLERRRKYADKSATPLAYIYYGHPALRLQRAP